MEELVVGRRQPGESEADRASRQSQSEDPHAVRRALLALDAGGMGSWQWDVPSGRVEGDERFARLFGFEADQAVTVDHVFSRIHPDDAQDVNEELAEAFGPGGEDYRAEFRICQPGKPPLWVGGRGRVVERAGDGSAVTMIGVNWDVSDLKAQEENLALLAGEMDHRVKNAFAVIRALITIGGRTAETKESLVEVLGAQVQAMAQAHSVTAALAREGTTPNVAVPVEDVLRSALAPWLGKEGGPTVTIEADEQATLVPRQVSSLAMLAYELATNAAKHGPLGDAGGTLTVTVKALTANDGALNVADEADEIVRTDARELVLVWHEEINDGDLAEAAALEAERGTPGGFGSTLLQHCAGSLRGQLKRELQPEGLHLELRWPVQPL